MNLSEYQSALWIFLQTFFSLFGPHLQHMEVPRLGVTLELQPPAYTTATAMQDLSHVCDLHHSSQQPQILNPLSEVRNRTHIMDTSRIHSRCTTTATPPVTFQMEAWAAPEKVQQRSFQRLSFIVV